HYNIDEDRIAKYPARKRAWSKLLILNRATGEINDSRFFHIKDYLHPGDLLVLNNTKVINARLRGRKRETGAEIEIFILEHEGGLAWKSLARPAKRLKPGTVIDFTDELTGVVEEKKGDGNVTVRFNSVNLSEFYRSIERIGEIPIPPYLKRSPERSDQKRYQTVYAEKAGAVAAPTAGLHFDKNLQEKIREMGVEFCYLTLHTGYGTFKPVESQDIRKHPIHSESYEILPEEYRKILLAVKEKRRIIPVGTTSMRLIEYMSACGGKKRYSGECGLYIYPGFRFKVSSALITNFHLPYSSLLLLVSAFAGRELILKAYEHALSNKYRFFSYGDSMLIL
ncbi:MAG TPA: tRNA preQ1(34) S-adenosylmethionine ribosyltransferase-isomerase QueA, partial [Firmicutes bacterium]|nr:tRNA preQ1(34) S-adenosylmethionine ribosyltransferase-isomerase QueA [Bacillota bacterium]